MLTAQEFRDTYSAEELSEKLPDRPISSLRDIQYLYGLLYTLGTAGGDEYAAYLSPDAASDLLDEEESLIVVRVDLSSDTPSLDPDQPVQIRSYSREHVSLVGHCKYESAAGIDHSITHKSGRGKKPDKLAQYAQDRLTRWSTDEHVQNAAENHDQSWIIDRLEELGENEKVLDRIEKCVKKQLSGKTTALITVRARLKENGEYNWPSEIPVMKEGMKQRLQAKLRSKNKATNSTGQATGIINHEKTQTVGTAEDPLNYFLGKQLETFPGFDPDESWRSHPISEDSAVTIMKAGPFSDACTYYSRYGATIYYMPYFLGHISPEEAYLLYSILSSAKNNEDLDERQMTPIEQVYEKIGHEATESGDDRLRFFLSVVIKQQMSRFDVFSDTMNARLIYPVSLARTHEKLLESWVFDVHGDSSSKISPPMPINDEWSLLQSGNYLNKVSTGTYFYDTFKYGDSDQDADADDARIQALAAVLSGGKIAVSTVLKSYVDRLLEEEGGDYFPHFFVSSQFAQLCALAQTEFLEADREELKSLCLAPDYLNRDMNSETNQDEAAENSTSHAALRDAKLEAFIEQTPAFEHPERRGVFLVGALVGQIGAYQQSSEGRSTTVVDQYSIKSITKHRLKQITQEVLDKNVVYSRKKNMQSTMYAEVVDRLIETLASCENEPEDWELSTEDLRFYYALGVTYGMNNWIESDSDSDNFSS